MSSDTRLAALEASLRNMATLLVSLATELHLERIARGYILACPHCGDETTDPTEHKRMIETCLYRPGGTMDPANRR